MGWVNVGERIYNLEYKKHFTVPIKHENVYVCVQSVGMFHLSDERNLSEKELF